MRFPVHLPLDAPVYSGARRAPGTRRTRRAPARPAALAASHTTTGVTARQSTTAHSTGLMGTVLKTACSGGTQSTESCITSPIRNARFMAALEKTPMCSSEARSLRTSKAWNSWHRVSVANAMVLAAAWASPGSESTYSPKK